MTIRIYSMDEAKARNAFDAHSAILKAQRENPSLCKNPAWTILRQDAYERFAQAFEVLC